MVSNRNTILSGPVAHRRSPIFMLLCLSALFLAACAANGVVPTEDLRPVVEAKREGIAAEAPEAAAAESDIVVEEIAEKERIDPKTRSEMRTFEATPVYFDFDKSTLSPDTQNVLRRLARWLQAHPAYAVRIEGHSDERGPDGYNLALGEGRANAAKHYLQRLGIDATRIATLSYGEERPADAGRNEAAWAKNRRAEFRFLRKP